MAIGGGCVPHIDSRLDFSKEDQGQGNQPKRDRGDDRSPGGRPVPSLISMGQRVRRGGLGHGLLPDAANDQRPDRIGNRQWQPLPGGDEQPVFRIERIMVGH